jgi:coenzyme F420-reducing hydrogenase delta subunit
MVPHPNQRIGRQMARVDADLCASCGICVGACPSSTPFRSAAELVTGIDMPSSPIGVLRNQLQQGLAGLSGEHKIVVFGCDRGARVAGLAAPDVAPFSLMCTGMLPPSFVEDALRDGASAVLVSGCRENGCEFRLGQRWSAARLAGTREPHLRGSVPRDRWATVWGDSGDESALRQAIDQLRTSLRGDVALAEAVPHG